MKPLLLSKSVPAAGSRAADYRDLTKPRISVLVLFTVAAGALLASESVPDPVLILHTVLGTALVAAGASALNQLLERNSDALMRRTENRPLPAGRLQSIEVLLFGIVVSSAGIFYLAVALEEPVAASIAAFTLASYVFLYTPLKRRTTLNTLVGAVPGALPPMIGWTAVRGTVDAEAIVLFALLFLWQVPHFLAIAWIYREDYARAGLQMLPVIDESGSMTGRQMVGYCLALIPISLAPVGLHMAGPIYFAGALAIGVGFLLTAIGFLRQRTETHARRVLRASLVYLPAVFALLLLARI
ncbi:MAG: protoheme IX farnesyltransferase [Gemmatales bacterium]|nr:MAG: protoheme IX farnesyltransferase [Gemmatales bacterium]